MLVLPAEAVRATEVMWGALSGAGSAMAMHFLNRGLSRGAMSIVVPVSAVTGVALSVLCGVLFLGPAHSTGLVRHLRHRARAVARLRRGRRRMRGRGRTRAGQASLDGLIASAGVVVQYIGPARADPASGLWPVAAGRLAAVVLLLPSARRHLPEFKQPPRLPGRAALVKAGAALGLSLYLRSAQQQMLAVAVVLASLYPAIPTVLGLAVLREQVTRSQAAGLVSAAAVVVLPTLG
ncbi:multidrug DMT transporter permease [Streptomyces sp. Wb2n-11]|uniref:multidrug DMT transporter permease n=1 Tax=Streptomyces sp. Wb2n-11 TaxID=1030533 RepID=UPI000AF00D2C|nr:multidrug DMT transporter permease [Streptomyces sp. Wb2n-11]